MAKRAISLNITVEATSEEMADESKLRELCMQKMHELLGTNWNPPYATRAWEDNVTVEPFDDEGDNDDEDGEPNLNRRDQSQFMSGVDPGEDFLINKSYGL